MFKVTQLVFDDNEDVSEVVVKLDTDTYQWASGVFGSHLSLERDPSANERPIPGAEALETTTATLRDSALLRIPRFTAIALFAAAGKVRGDDPIREVTDTVYRSLQNVMVMLDDEW